MKGDIYYGSSTLNIERFPLLKHLSYVLRNPYKGDLSELVFDEKRDGIKDYDGINPFEICGIRLNALESSISTSHDKPSILRFSELSGYDPSDKQPFGMIDKYHVERLGLYKTPSGNDKVTEKDKVVEIVRIDDLISKKHIIRGHRKGIFPRSLGGYNRTKVSDPRPWLMYLLRAFQGRKLHSN